MKRNTTAERSCRGKIRYASKAAAERGLFETTVRFDDYGMHCYRCRHCGGWHVGHRNREKKLHEAMLMARYQAY